jgi:HNH endonuclease
MHHNQHSGRIFDRLSNYSDESLLKELRRIAKVLGTTSLTLDQFEEHGRCSYALLKQRFGGLSRRELVSLLHRTQKGGGSC